MFVLFLFLAMTAPSFDSCGEINECIGCPAMGHDDYCKKCKFNPEYWNGYNYIGPSNKELRRMK